MRTGITAFILLAMIAAAFIWGSRSQSKPVADSLQPAAALMPDRHGDIELPAIPSPAPAPRDVVVEGAGPSDASEARAAESAPRELVLRVVSDATGAPIEGAHVGGEWGTRTDRQGLARLSVEPDEIATTRWAPVSAEGFVGRHVTVPPRKWEWEARLTPGIPFELRVTDDASGEPVVGAHVWARQWDEEADEMKSRSEATTGKNGVASIPPVHQDMPVTLRLEAGGYVARELNLTIQWPGRHDVEMGAAGRIAGRVLGREGEPVPRAAISLEALHRTRAEFGTRVWTDENGEFSLAGLRLDAAYVLKCSAPPASFGPFTLTAAESERWVELRSDSSPATLRITVTDESGAPWTSTWVSVNRWVSEEYARWPEGMRDDYIGQARTDDEGLAEVELSKHGAFEVVVWNAGGALVTQRGSVDPGGVEQVGIVLPRGLTLRGRVSDEEGRSLPGMSVRFGRAGATTGAAGEFELIGLSSEPRDLIVFQTEPGSATVPARITCLHFHDVVPGVDRMELRRPAPVTLSGRFADAPDLVRATWSVSLEGRMSLTCYSVLEEDRSTGIEVAIRGVDWGLGVAGLGDNGNLDVFPDLDPAPGTQVNLGELGLRSDRTVSGRVWMPARRPAVGARVELSVDGFRYVRDATTDYQGFFEFDGVPASDGWIDARADEGFVSKARRFEHGSGAVTMEFQLEQEPLLYGHVRRADGSVVQYETVWLYSVRADGEFRSGSGKRMEEDGSYEMRSEPGTYQIIVTPLGVGEPVLGPVVELVRGVDVEMDIEVP